MSLRGTWRAIKQNAPKPAWIRLPGQQRFCVCCSIRTGASVIGWFNFIVNSLYIGMLLLVIRQIRDDAAQAIKTHMIYGPPDTLGDEQASEAETTETYDVKLSPHDGDNISAVITASSLEEYKQHREVVDVTLPIMYKSICIPALMTIFSILWLITVEARSLILVKLFGRAFILAIVAQLIAQLGFLIYIEVEVEEESISAIVWVIFVVYAIINIYFIPIIGEYLKRRIREWSQGMEQGLLTSEMYPRARVEEEYIQDAFTVEPDTDMVQFEASLVRDHSSETTNDKRYFGEESDEESPI